MVEKTIRLSGIEDAKKLVTLAMKCNFPVELTSNDISIDAKSIMGIFSLEFGSDTTLKLDCDTDNSIVSEFSCFFK